MSVIGLRLRAWLAEGRGSRYLREAELVLLASLVGLFIAECVVLSTLAVTWDKVVASDYTSYMNAGSRWLHGGSFYLPYQLSGPYPVIQHEIMYPPTLLFLLVPFTFLPAPLWFAIPTGITIWYTVSFRPSILAWCGIFACLSFPWTPQVWLTGNPVIWVLAGIAAGIRLGWPLAVLAIKPQFAPFALFGFKRRSFWVASLAVGFASLLLLPVWFEWLTILRNVQSWPGNSAVYWLNNLPLLAVPVIAWLGRKRPGLRPDSGGAR
jgi:hypothetical protein